MSVYYFASLKISYFIGQNLGNKAKPRDHDPPGYFRSQKYSGYEVVNNVGSKTFFNFVFNSSEQVAIFAAYPNSF